MAVIVYGLTAALYAALLGGMYNSGYWGIDLVVLLLAETALIGGFAGMIGYAKMSTQNIARWYVVRQFGVLLAVLSILHTVCSIVVPLNIEIFYWIIFGVGVIWFAVKMYFVHTGALMQEQTERDQQALHAKQQALASTLHVPTTMLVAAIEASGARQDAKSAAADAVKAVSAIVDGFSLKKLERNPALIGEIDKWNMRLAEMKTSLAADNSDAALHSIASEARLITEVINNLYLC